MAYHVRRQIREAIATAVTGLAATGARVYQSRVYPVESGSLPCLLVYSNNEASEPATIHPTRLIERTLTVELVAVAKATSDLDDTLDEICKQIETALAMPVAGLATLAKEIHLQETAYELAGTAEKPTGTARLTYAVAYFTAENAPDVAQ